MCDEEEERLLDGDSDVLEERDLIDETDDVKLRAGEVILSLELAECLLVFRDGDMDMDRSLRDSEPLRQVKLTKFSN